MQVHSPRSQGNEHSMSLWCLEDGCVVFFLILVDKVGNIML